MGIADYQADFLAKEVLIPYAADARAMMHRDSYLADALVRPRGYMQPTAYMESSAINRNSVTHPNTALDGDGGYADASSYSVGNEVCSKAENRPLKVIHIGSFLVGAGIENWQVALVKHVDRNCLQFIRSVVTTDLVDQSIVRRLGIPVTMGGRDAVRQAARDADILLVSGPGELGEWLSDIPRPPTVFVAHGDGEWTNNILNRVRQSIDHVVAVSQHVKNSIKTQVPTTVIHNAIDPDHLTISRSREDVRGSLGFDTKDFVLGYVGRFSPEKNPFALIAALERLPKKFKLLFVGFGVLRDQLLDQTARRIPGRYAFVEAEEHLGNYYQAMDAHCLPSLSEGYGLVVMEAMFCGCPVISGPVGFAPESLSNRVNGLIVDGSPSSFAEVATLLRAHPRWRRAVADEGRQYAFHYGLPQRMANKYVDLLERVHAAYRPSR